MTPYSAPNSSHILSRALKDETVGARTVLSTAYISAPINSWSKNHPTPLFSKRAITYPYTRWAEQVTEPLHGGRHSLLRKYPIGNHPTTFALLVSGTCSTIILWRMTDYHVLSMFRITCQNKTCRNPQKHPIGHSRHDPCEMYSNLPLP